jgi:hypothetical protein
LELVWARVTELGSKLAWVWVRVMELKLELGSKLAWVMA